MCTNNSVASLPLTFRCEHCRQIAWQGKDIGLAAIPAADIRECAQDVEHIIAKVVEDIREIVTVLYYLSVSHGAEPLTVWQAIWKGVFYGPCQKENFEPANIEESDTTA